jgi:NADH:ubiquinone oxidoreductase subunit F (NADH-binding)
VKQGTGTLLPTSPVGSLDDYLAQGGSEGLTNAISRRPEEIINEIKRSGLRGRGGAGFPTGAKWEAVRNAGPGAKYIVCNGAEGEPGTFKDRLLMRRNPYQVIEGLAIGAFAVGAQEAHIALKRSFTAELAAILLGAMPIVVDEGPDEYLFGEEKAMLEVIEGNPPMPRILPPYQQGLFAKPDAPNPTAANNVETLANVPHIMRLGAERFRSAGTERSPGMMLFTISGDVQTHGVFELPLGTPLRTLVYDIAGGPPEGREVKAIFPGASASVLTAEHLDVPMDFDALEDAGSGLGSAGFVVYDESACIVRATRDFSRFLWIESCAQCPPCKQGSEDITAALERIESGEGAELDLTTMQERTLTVTDGKRCALPNGEAFIAASCLERFADEFREHLGRKCPRPRELAFPKIVDYDEQNGRFIYDERYARKRADWTYAE